jgi:hypothetical protein
MFLESEKTLQQAKLSHHVKAMLQFRTVLLY